MNAEQVRVRVLGTSFNVNTYDKNYIETVLVKGRVGLQMEGNTQEWQIKPNELARYDRKNKTMEVKEVDILPYVTWKDENAYYYRAICRIHLNNREGACDDIQIAYNLTTDKEFEKELTEMWNKCKCF